MENNNYEMHHFIKLLWHLKIRLHESLIIFSDGDAIKTENNDKSITR